MFDRILIAFDETKAAGPLLGGAISMSNPHRAEILLVTVRTAGERHPSAGLPAPGEPLELAAASLRDAGYDVRARVCQAPRGKVADAIVRAIDEFGPELVVMGSRGLTDLEALVQGSVSHRVLAAAGCPVLVIRDSASLEPPRRLLVAFDDSHHSRRAARVAAELARSTGAEMDVVLVKRPLLAEAAVVLDTDVAQRRLQELLETVCSDVVATGSVKVSAAGKAACIADVADQAGADLIVMGTRGLSRIAGAAIGSVSHQVIHLSHRQVLLVP